MSRGIGLEGEEHALFLQDAAGERGGEAAPGLDQDTDWNVALLDQDRGQELVFGLRDGERAQEHVV